MQDFKEEKCMCTQAQSYLLFLAIFLYFLSQIYIIYALELSTMTNPKHQCHLGPSELCTSLNCGDCPGEGKVCWRLCSIVTALSLHFICTFGLLISHGRNQVAYISRMALEVWSLWYYKMLSIKKNKIIRLNLELSNIQNSICMCGNQAPLLPFRFGHHSSWCSDEDVPFVKSAKAPETGRAQHTLNLRSHRLSYCLLAYTKLHIWKLFLKLAILTDELSFLLPTTPQGQLNFQAQT